MWLIITAWWACVGVAWGSYDEYMTCGSGSERYGRHYHPPHLPELPCDISKNSWCESAGTQYPWSSVRKFVYENQGLMKRMYGNQRHYNVLRAEMLNELYDDMFEEMPRRHHQYRRPPPPQARSARYQKPSRANSFRDKKSGGRAGSKHQNSHESIPKQHRTSHESHPTHRTTSQEAEVTQQASDESKSKQQQTDPGQVPSNHRSEHESRAMKLGETPEYSTVRRHHEHPRPRIQYKIPKIHRKSEGPTIITQEPHPSSSITTTSTTITRQTTTPTSSSEPGTTTIFDDWTTTESQWYDTDDPTDETLLHHNTQPTTLPHDGLLETELMEDEGWTTTLSDSTLSSSYSTPYLDHEVESSYISVTVPETSTSAVPTSRTDILDELLEDEGYISTPLDEDDMTTLTLAADDFEQLDGEEENLAGNLKEEEEEQFGDEEAIVENLKVENREQVAAGIKAETREGVVGGGMRVDDLRVEGNVREEAKTEAPTTTQESFNIKPPVRGMNACPVKEEFVAPYWANNTRGETLALLNLYPFEQYVQWERCKFEHRQMYCRAGCRCEQQYRLHKLLAFDPTNECRGIFSDWFRFPSCCVCKCYDLPSELFMSSSRRPRINSDDEDDYEYMDDEEEEEDDDDDDDYDFYPAPPRRTPVANIPPQRRPRLPPRPYSHISPPSYTLRPPLPPPSSTNEQSGDEVNPPSQSMLTSASTQHSQTVRVKFPGGTNTHTRATQQDSPWVNTGATQQDSPWVNTGTQHDSKQTRTFPRTNSRSTKFPGAQTREIPAGQRYPSLPQHQQQQQNHNYHEQISVRQPRYPIPPPGHGATQAPSPQWPPETSTLGTLDAATPHYYFNLTNYARSLMASGATDILSRIPRSAEEEQEE
ncbi:hypothetical protein Pcinc_016688 [Petrolisthes cinctipes]|uniref:Spaetzle domain-containing protein n=1 Tax=Petrolisthes cinctipes TaxID=88211 RepID=A0AAE1KPA6_PETCI|nr:hypothetical protein Pcinc_016688 [Petrolisthes cinctipes]